jgi:hypothetical protein
MKFAKSRPGKFQSVLRRAGMFCLDDGPTLEAFFTFVAFLLVFVIGLGLGLVARAQRFNLSRLPFACACA